MEAKLDAMIAKITMREEKSAEREQRWKRRWEAKIIDGKK